MGATVSKQPPMLKWTGTALVMAVGLAVVYRHMQEVEEENCLRKGRDDAPAVAAVSKRCAPPSETMQFGRVKVPLMALIKTPKESVADIRDQFKSAGEPKYYENMFINSVRTLKVYSSPNHRLAKSIIMYVHGGQYVAGDSSCYSDVLQTLAGQTNLPVYSVDYTLCPEGSLEDSLKDVLSVYKALRRNYQVHLVGDGSGTNLILRLVKELGADASIPPTTVSLFNLVESYSQQPLRNFAEKFLCQDAQELDCLEVQDIRTRSLGAGIKQFEQMVGKDLSDSEIKLACNMIRKRSLLSARS